MKKQFIALASLSILVSGCGAKPEEKTAENTTGCDVLNIINWGEYIDESIIPNFEKANGVRVNYTMIDSNEGMYTKLLSDTSAYDLVIPSDYMIERLIQEKLIQKLDPNKIPDLSVLNQRLNDLDFDPNHEYAVPYLWGSWGILYNKNTVDGKEVEEKGYEIFQNEKYADRVFMYDSVRNGFMVGLKALGYSMNTTDETEIEKAYEWLVEGNKKVHYSFVRDEVIDGMVTGEKDIALMYSGDAAYVLTQNPDMAFAFPKQGTNLWVDAMVIPVGSKCADLSYRFMNFMYEEENALANSLYVGYTSPLDSVIQELTSKEGGYFENPAYLPPENGKLDEWLHYLPDVNEKMSELWLKVKDAAN